MTAQMNIKSDEAYALACELAGRAGTSLTQAVLDALRAQSAKLDRTRKIVDLLEFSRQTAAMMSPETLSFDIDEELYDENGLPK